MSTGRELVETCRRMNVELRREGDGLRVRDPHGRVTPPLLGLLREHKADVLAELPLPCTGCGRFAFPKPMKCRWCRTLHLTDEP